jgi:hypothetical protein
VFVFFGAGIIASFAQMARDAILSRLSGTDAGKLDPSFYLRVLSKPSMRRGPLETSGNL